MNNPNNFNSSEFDVDDEIAKLWKDLEAEFSNIKTDQQPTKVQTQERKFVPPSTPTGQPNGGRAPEIPRFSEPSVSRKPEVENGKREWKLPPTVSAAPIKEPVVPKKPLTPQNEFTKNSAETRNEPQIPNFNKTTSEKPKTWNLPPTIDDEPTEINFDFLDKAVANEGPEIIDLSGGSKGKVASYNKYLDELTTYQQEKEKTEKLKEREKARIAGKKANHTVKNARKLLKNLSSICQTDKKQNNESQNKKLAEKYKIFDGKKHEKRQSSHSVGQKTVAAALVVLVVGGIGVTASRERKKNQSAVERETAAGIVEEDTSYEERQSQESFTIENEDGEKITAIFENVDNEPQMTESSSEEDETVAELDVDSTTEQNVDVSESNTESSSESYEEKEAFSQENISSKEAYQNITELLESGKYLNIDAECTADYFTEVCKMVGFSLNQTSAMLANGGHESQWCALLKQLGGSGFGFFQFDGANMYGREGEDYYNDGNRMTYDGFKEYMRKIDPQVYNYCFNENPFKNVGYEVNDNLIEEILQKTGTKELYERTLVRQLQYIYYVTQEDNWENNQMNKVNNSSNAYDCTWNFAKFVERPSDRSDGNMDKRASTGVRIYNMIKEGLSLLEANPKM